MQSRLSSITFYTDDIAKMIQNLDPNKAHGHDQISIRMPSLIIFNQYLKKGTFPNAWKKAMLFPSSKKAINKFSETTARYRETNIQRNVQIFH